VGVVRIGQPAPSSRRLCRQPADGIDEAGWIYGNGWSCQGLAEQDQ
jgi:hypothetical protein